jgi:hypothetical protein
VVHRHVQGIPASASPVCALLETVIRASGMALIAVTLLTVGMYGVINASFILGAFVGGSRVD